MRRFISIAVFLLSIPVFAQANLIPTYSGGLQLGMTPQYPRAGDTVTLTVANYSGNADSTTYTWTVNGKTVLAGIGQKTITLQAGPSGSTQDVSVTAEQNRELVGTLSAHIHPADVDVLWEGQTTIPPFYQGRPLPNAASPITVLAVPHIALNGSELPASSLIYSWKQNGIALADASGYGKSSLVITPPRFGQTFTVSVHVENTSGSAAAEGSATITPQTPTIVIYEHAPLLGIRFEKNISSVFPFSGDEISFAAFPLFFANTSILGGQWSLDGQTFAVDPQNPREVTFRKTSGASGTHAVTFSLVNPKGFLEQASASFKLSF